MNADFLLTYDRSAVSEKPLNPLNLRTSAFICGSCFSFFAPLRHAASLREVLRAGSLREFFGVWLLSLP
jgi:hypothetical protein